MTSNEGWIKCPDRMHEKTDDIIVAFSDGYVMYGFSYSDREGFCFEGEKIGGVTHWQPLPEPPQEGNHDKS